MGRLREAWNTMLGRPAVRSVSFQDVFGEGGDVDLFPTGIAGTLSLVSLYSTIRLIADQFASTPLNGYQLAADRSMTQMSTPPALLKPARGSLATWKTQLIVSLLTRGNAYGIPTSSDRSGWPSGVMWVDPATVGCDDLNPTNPNWTWNGRPLDESEIIHVPWIVPPGRVKGLSPLGLFKTLWETGHAAQRATRNFYKADGMPAGHLKNVAMELEQEQATVAKARFKKAVQGRDILVTGNDWDFTTIGLPADQLAFVAALKLTATQVASIYGVAPEDVGGEAAAGLQYSTVEMNEIKLSTRTMRPWYERCESTFNEVTPRTQVLRFDADSMVRTDLMTRMKAHAIQLATGLETNEEGRIAEGRAPLTPDQIAAWKAAYPNATAVQPLKETE